MADSLSDAHRNELARFAQFFRGKRDVYTRHVMQMMEELGDDRIVEEILQKGEVQAIWEDGKQQVGAVVAESLEQQNLQALAHLATLLSFAQAAGVELEADVRTVEDTVACQQASAVANAVGQPRPAPTASRLPAMGSAGAGAGGQEIRDLKEENRKMVDRYQQMQKQVSDLLKERSMLADELEQVKMTFKELKGQLQSGQAGATETMEMALLNARTQLEAKSGELEAISGELNRHIGESSQFREMRGIIAKKNQQMKALRNRLAQYEPLDDTPVDED